MRGPAQLLERIRDLLVSDSHPMVFCELPNDPITSEPPDAAVLLAAERTSWRVVCAEIIHMGHPRLNTKRKADPAIFVPTEHRA